MIYLISLFVFLVGCQNAKLKPDPSMSAIEANYPTAEFRACGSVWHGIGTCSVKRGESLDTLKLGIQGYYKGTVKIVSGCGFNSNEFYENNQLVEVRSGQVAEKPCVASFVVTPEFPENQKNPVLTRSLKGVLAIAIHEDGDSIMLFSSKVKETLSDEIMIPSAGEARVVFRGCGANYDKMMKPVDGFIRIKSSDVRPIGIEECVLSGGVSTSPVTYVTWMLWGYSKEFQPLAIPKVNIEKGKVSIEAQDVVSVVSAGDNYKVSNVGKFKVDTSKEFVIRAISVSGRTVIGVYDPKSKEISWKQ